jgi:hypothetical protein
MRIETCICGLPPFVSVSSVFLSHKEYSRQALELTSPVFMIAEGDSLAPLGIHCNPQKGSQGT